MKYSVGDKVVHPKRGAGTITGIEHHELVEGFEDYYVIEIRAQGLTLYVPMDMVDHLGVRPVVSKPRVDQVLDVLGERPGRLPDGYKLRQASVREKLGTGSAMQIAETVRDLVGHEQRAHLTRVDKRLLEEGREFLAGEIALITESEILEAQEAIEVALPEALD
jgi:RNA polymerase-interacting CarD/CdnL/TRCF family regulator